jgi:hypothetical protein
MSSVVETYWSGVVARLQAEVDVFSALVNHWGERGQENEQVLGRILRALVPGRYGIGSGLVIDSEGGCSRQIDLIVYDQADEPTVLAQTTQLLFPVENVRAAIEVKTTVEGEDVKAAGRNAAALRALAPAVEQGNGGRHPLYVLLGYHAGQRPETIARHLQELAVDERPDIVCIVNAGIFGEASAPGHPPVRGALEVGVTLLHARDAAGDRVGGSYEGPGAETPDEDQTLARFGHRYPVSEIGGARCLVEPPRAFLLFCEAMVRRLADQDCRRASTMSYYLKGPVRELRPL